MLFDLRLELPWYQHAFIDFKCLFNKYKKII
jgi:hypothetical protein